MLFFYAISIGALIAFYETPQNELEEASTAL